MRKLLLTSLFAFIFSLCTLDVQAQVIVCGHTPQNKPVKCDLSTNICLKCDKARTEGAWGFNFRRLWGTLKLDRKHNLFYDETEITTYKCQSKGDFVIPLGCSVTNIGGETGAVRKSFLGLPYQREEGHECVMDNIKSYYSQTCFSCQIVEALASAFIKGAAKAYDVSRQAANVVLTVGMLLWLGIFVLKNISSFKTVEPMKMLQDLLIQFFKALVAFTIINAGISTILHYTMEPLMLAGTDLADTITNSTVEADIEASQKIAEALRQEQQTPQTGQDLSAPDGGKP